MHMALLKNALYVPSYKQDIFSVHAAVSKGATVNFSPDNAKLLSPDGTAMVYFEFQTIFQFVSDRNFCYSAQLHKYLYL